MFKEDSHAGVLPTGLPSTLGKASKSMGMAGGLTKFGIREVILLIREIEAERTTAGLDLTSREKIDSPYYYLQQNDIIYIQPIKDKTK